MYIFRDGAKAKNVFTFDWSGYMVHLIVCC